MFDTDVDISLNLVSLPIKKQGRKQKIKKKSSRRNTDILSSISDRHDLHSDTVISKQEETSDRVKGQKKPFKRLLPSNEGDYNFDEYDFTKKSDDTGRKVNTETNKFSSLFTHNPDIPVHIRRAVTPVSEPVFSSKTFEDLPIHRYMVSNLKQNMNLDQLTTVQQKAIPIILSGKDALVRSQTGSGKTLAYAIPIIEALQNIRPKINRAEGVRALIVVPTRELALQSYEWFLKLVKSFTWLVPGYLVGGEKRKSEKARLRKGINILIGTPGRLYDHIQTTKSLHLNKVQWLILDEADRLLDMGYEKVVSDIVTALDSQQNDTADINNYNDSDDKQGESQNRQTVLLSATLTTAVERLAGLALKDPVFVDAAVEDEPSRKKKKNADKISKLGADIVIPNSLDQYYIITPAKLRLVTLSSFIIWRCKLSDERKMLIFCATQDMVDYLTELLSSILGTSDKTSDNFLHDENEESDEESDHKVVDVEFFKLHGSMTQKERTEVFKTFRSADSGVLLCTDVAARGLDLPHVDWIVQYNAPCNVSDYVHRVGRTARVGSNGSALLFLTPSEIQFVSRLEDRRIKLTEEKMQQCLQHLLDYTPRQRRSGPFTPQEAATALQLRFENALLERKDLHELACKAYVSWVRFYASYPKETRDVFNFKEAHLGHYAKSFAIRDPPKWIAGIGKRKNKGHKNDNRTKNQQPERGHQKFGTDRPRGMNKKHKIFSEFDSGLEPVKKKQKTR